MSHATVSELAPKSTAKMVADSFSKSVILISGLMILQRGIGFLRSFYVCGKLSPAEVGQWDLAFSFLMLAAPLAVFGIPGSFGRYVAKFEHNGQQSRFLLQTMIACLGLTAIAAMAIWMFKDTVALYCMGGSEGSEMVSLLAIGLPVVVFFNFATSWFSGKRLNRFVFRIQFAQTLFFALLCIATFTLFSVTAYSVVLSYLISCALGMFLAASYAFAKDPEDCSDVNSDRSESIWRKILPFAAWVWVGNALINLFSVCDRILLVNFYPDKSIDIQFLVGQYHTACIFPLLLMAIGAMAGSTVLPYLSKDWESGARAAVATRMNLMIKLMGVFCMLTSVAIMLFAPVLFGELWQNKFALGESLLPMTLCYCSFAAMTLIAQQYFWCLEKTWICSLMLLIGLVSNFFVGMFLIADYGINGVVASTLIAHAIVLSGMLLFSRAYELRIDTGVLLICAAIATLCLGKMIALASLVALLAGVAFTPLLISDELRQSLYQRFRASQRLGHR